MNPRNKKVLAGVLACAVVVSTGSAVFAATEGKFCNGASSSVSSTDTKWNDWTETWKTVSTDYTKVSMTPGADDTQMNFAWYSKTVSGKDATPVVLFGTDKNNLKEFTGTFGTVNEKLVSGYQYNHVTVTGLTENTTYYYSVERNGEKSEPVQYKTGSFSHMKMLYVGDPQIGASKGQTQNAAKLEEKDGEANTAARNDAYGWDRTLDIAAQQNPDLNFIISAGDQVNKTGKAKEEEYAGFLNANVLQSLPVATTIGNHDSLNEDYSYHFNDPNRTGNGKTTAGSDYYHSYGSALFVVLNTNNYNCAEHEDTLKKATAAYPSAKWRIVTIHQDIYGSGLDHSETDGMILRTQLTPIFDKYDVDVVLQGHDHTYSRTKLLEGDAQSHGEYEMPFDTASNDYDWDNVKNNVTGETIPFSPAAGNSKAQSAHNKFMADNKCYVMQDAPSGTVTNPSGTLYMTANSASGSKYYELLSTQQDYVAKRSQNWLPSYSVIDLTNDTFKIDTYQITDAGSTEKIDQTFTIIKNGAADTATVKCSQSGTVKTPLGYNTAFTVKTDKAPASVNAGSKDATINTLKAWNASTKTATYAVYGLHNNKEVGIYVNGTKQFTASTNARPFSSDTNTDLAVKKGQQYTFAVTVPKGGNKPAFTVGSGSALQTLAKGSKSNADGSVTYLYGIRAIGSKGQQTGIYIMLDDKLYCVFRGTVG